MQREGPALGRRRRVQAGNRGFSQRDRILRILQGWRRCRVVVGVVPLFLQVGEGGGKGQQRRGEAEVGGLDAGLLGEAMLQCAIALGPAAVGRADGARQPFSQSVARASKTA